MIDSPPLPPRPLPLPPPPPLPPPGVPPPPLRSSAYRSSNSLPSTVTPLCFFSALVARSMSSKRINPKL